MLRSSRSPHIVSLLRRDWGPLLVVLALGILLPAKPGGAQQVAEPPTPQAPALMNPDSLVIPSPGSVSPGGAFLRAILVPGWGHASIGSYHRGAFYFVAEGATAWMLLKSRRRFSEAQGRVAFHEKVIRADLAAEGVTEEPDIQEALDADPTLEDLRNLVEARRQQREDWTAVGIFLILLSGADAFVSAHLKDFPVPIEINAEPVGQGRMELSLGLTLPR